MKTIFVNRIKKWIIFALIGCCAYFVGYIWGKSNLTTSPAPQPPTIESAK